MKLSREDQGHLLALSTVDHVNPLASIEDSDFTNLFVGKKLNDIVLCLDDNQTVRDEFLGARVSRSKSVVDERGW
ncbi:hypothetical protein U1Q18_019942 [Sarracenia purpurea var. burkii]